MNTLLSITQIVLALILTTFIFLQTKGLNENNSNILSQSGVQRRGWEKVIFNLTIIVTVLFLINSVIQLLN